MAVLCCYVTGDPLEDGRFHEHRAKQDGLASVRRHAPQAELVDVTGDQFGYWREIRTRWQGTGDLVIVEHDIVIGPDTISSLEGCDRDWCSFSYDIFGCKVLTSSLGCTRFSAALQRAVSLDEVAASFADCPHCEGKGCWWHLDNYLAAFLLGRGFEPHVHGTVEHLHDYGPPGTISLMPGIMTVYSWEEGQEPVQFHVEVEPA